MDTNDDLYVCDSCGWKGNWDDISGRCIDYYYNWNVEDEVMTIVRDVKIKYMMVAKIENN